MAYKREYEESDAVRQARALAAQTAAQKPGAYNSQWKSPMEQAAQQIANRKGFQYNMGTDPLYNQYRQQYMRQGKMAMADTMGQAAAGNGGYGSSYAQTAGQQVYNQHIQQLNDKIPELYGMALQKYQAEGEDLMNRFGVLGQMESQDYGRYRDQLGDWQTERSYADDRLNQERSYDRSSFESDRSFGYGAEQDEKEEAWRQAQFDYTREQDQKNWDWKQAQFDYEKEQDTYNRQKAEHDTYMKFAQDEVEYLLEHGEEIPEWLLRQSEFDPAYIAAAQKAWAAQNSKNWDWGSGSSSGSGSSGGSKDKLKSSGLAGTASTPKSDSGVFNMLRDVSDAYAAQGATAEQLEEFERKARGYLAGK